MKARETELRAEVDRWPEAAEAADAQENKLQGASRRGDEMSDNMLALATRKIQASGRDRAQGRR
jgi:hypothetical protein